MDRKLKILSRVRGVRELNVSGAEKLGINLLIANNKLVIKLKIGIGMLPKTAACQIIDNHATKMRASLEWHGLQHSWIVISAHISLKYHATFNCTVQYNS
jgi:hypothetical protein